MCVCMCMCVCVCVCEGGGGVDSRVTVSIPWSWCTGLSRVAIFLKEEMKSAKTHKPTFCSTTKLEGSNCRLYKDMIN